MEKETVNSPAHYNIGNIEVIDAIEDWQLNFSRGNAVKYIARAGHKDKSKEIEDLKKARWYLDREIERLKKEEDRKKPAKQYIPYEESVSIQVPLQDPVEQYKEPRAVCIQATPFGTAVVDSCTLKAYKD